jgi:arginyl-tRNA synthetase
MEWYKAAKAVFDADPEFKKRSQLEVVSLQGGNPESLEAWKEICAISRKGYQEIYDLLDVRLNERGESTYNPVLPQTVADLEAKGIVENSQGAKCIFIEGLPIPLMIQKSDGGYNYDTTDMAALRQRVEEEKANRIIYVTDLGQSLHFQLLFKAAEKAGWVDPAKVRLDHVTFGLVLGNDGKKFKTRSGDTEKLIDLLLTAVQEAEKILEARSPEMDPSERKTLAKALGLSAVKYADLSCHRTSDYVFAYDKMLRFEGNTAAYMMYSYVRVLGIKRKIGSEADSLIASAQLHLEHPSEIALALALTRFEEVLSSYAESLLPHRLTDYLYQLADKFNAFFRDCRVEGSAEMGSRLILAETTAKVLKQGFDLLGLVTVEKM